MASSPLIIKGVIMTVGNWALPLTTVEDLKEYEDNIIDQAGTVEETQKKIDLIKEEIAERLRANVKRTLDRNGIDIANWPVEVLDLIQNPEVFKRANIFGAIYLIFEELIISPESSYAMVKRETYRTRYFEERNFAENRYTLDENASGDIEAGERLILRGFVRTIC